MSRLARITLPVVYACRVLTRLGSTADKIIAMAIVVVLVFCESDVGPVQVQEPMDLLTLMVHVDNRKYGTLAAFADDLAHIPAAEAAFWGDDPDGVPEVQNWFSRSYIDVWEQLA